MVRPRAVNPSIACQNPRRVSTSMAAVGSSRMRSARVADERHRKPKALRLSARETVDAALLEAVELSDLDDLVERERRRHRGCAPSPAARPTRTPGIMPPSWSIAPTLACAIGRSRLGSRRARCGRSRAPTRPRSIEIVVVLPAPLGPSRAIVSPWPTRRLMLSTASTAPKRRLTPSTRTAHSSPSGEVESLRPARPRRRGDMSCAQPEARGASPIVRRVRNLV